MNCKEAMDITDNYLNENTELYNEQEFKQHINECKGCLSAYEDIMDIKYSLENLEYLPLPENFHNELTEKLVSAEKKTKKHIWVKYAAVAACACIVFITGGYIKSGFSSYFKAGAATGMDYNSASAGSVQEFSATADAASKVSADTGAYDDNYSADMANNTESAVSAGIHGEKLIKNGYISVSVDDYDKAEKNIKDYILQIPISYNFCNSYRFYNYKALVKMMKPTKFISKEDYQVQCNNPIIIHFLGEERPWRVGNKHTYTNEYMFYWNKTPWANTPLELGWENYFKAFNLFNTVMKPFPMLRYKIMDTLIPIMIKHRKKS